MTRRAVALPMFVAVAVLSACGAASTAEDGSSAPASSASALVVDEATAAVVLPAGLTIADTLFAAPYLSTSPSHQGLLLHSVYHRPNGWDYIPPGRKVPCGEACMWGDYHIREVCLYLQRMINNDTYYTFFNCVK